VPPSRHSRRASSASDPRSAPKARQAEVRILSPRPLLFKHLRSQSARSSFTQSPP
jgi:hypothetical protein